MDADGPSLRRIVTELAVQEATGRLVLADPGGRRGWIWLRDGAINGASGPGPKPLLANRLRAFGILTPQRIRKAMAEAAQEPGTLLLDVVSDLVPGTFLTDFLELAMAEQITFIEALGTARVRFSNGEVTASAPTVFPADVLLDLAERMSVTSEAVSESDAYVIEPGGGTPVTVLERVVAQACDGNRNLQQIANVAGLTKYEVIVAVEELLANQHIRLSEGPAAGPWEVQQPYPDGVGSTPAAAETTGPEVIGGSVPAGRATGTDESDAPETGTSAEARRAGTDSSGSSEGSGLEDAVGDILGGMEPGPGDPDGGTQSEQPRQDPSPEGTGTQQGPAATPTLEPDQGRGRRPPSPNRRRRVDPGSRRSALSELSALGDVGGAEQAETASAAPATQEEPQEAAAKEPDTEREQDSDVTPRTARDPRAASDLMKQLRELSAEHDDD